MSVNAGQPVTAAVVNNAFPSRITNSSIESIISLENTAAASGPTITNLQASINASGVVKYAQQVLAAGGTIDFADGVGTQVRPIKSSGGNVTVASLAFGAGVPTNAAQIVLVGTSSTDTVTIENHDAANGIALNGSITFEAGTILRLIYISDLERFVEVGRNGL